MRVALVCFSYPVGTSTILINMLTMLVRMGANIDVFSDSASLQSPPLPRMDRVHLHDLDNCGLLNKVRFKLIRIFHRALRPGSYEAGLEGLRQGWFAKTLATRARMSLNEYEVVFYASYQNLFALPLLPMQKKNIYITLEMLDDTAPSGQDPYINKQLCRHLEHTALTQTDHAIALSPRRKTIFAATAKFPPERISVLPIVPMGRRPEASRYFREKLDIPATTKLFVYSGGIGDWAQLLEIVESVRNWPDDTCLVIHTWNPAILDTPYAERLKEEAKGLPVHFSGEELSHTQLMEALAGVDAGIAFYAQLDDNFSEIMFSSNKICEYLRAGLPVLTSNSPDLCEFMAEQRVGIAGPVADLADNVHRLLSNYNDFKSNIAPCLQRVFDFERCFLDFAANNMPSA
ncbi:glycosyltransferase [Desulfocurvibacter africanus PCS]|uniref:Glycosyltransferase n=1 Tax=Desulfocurvibacter africanus PCS TaxID=1262666 RepID=M5PVQ7_DESAF|nr:hypothetical protein [Desulfocurvibacter africanus]EMG38422.1 glycosyltransferase [Desulfocurvibacter africanus PCS]